jgi:hypothetical protein
VVFRHGIWNITVEIQAVKRSADRVSISSLLAAMSAERFRQVFVAVSHGAAQRLEFP